MAIQPLCKQCGKRIDGNYVSALGATWHPEHFLCAACGRPIDDMHFNLHQGMLYHSDCYRDHAAPKCAYCGKPLIGTYTEYNGTPYHLECYTEHVANRCAY